MMRSEQLLVGVLLLSVMAVGTPYVITGTQSQFPYTVYFTVESSDSYALTLEWLTSSDLNWFIYTKTGSSSIISAGSGAELSENKTGSISAGTYRLSIIKYSSNPCGDWTLTLTIPSLTTTISGCDTMSEDTCGQCATATSQSVSIYRIPLYACIDPATLIDQCLIYDTDASLTCFRCSGTNPYYGSLQDGTKKCLALGVSNCQIYKQDQSECVQCLPNYFLVTSNSAIPTSVKICISNFIENCDIFSADGSICVTCNPSFPILTNIYYTGNRKKCIAPINKNFTYSGSVGDLPNLVYFQISQPCDSNITLRWSVYGLDLDWYIYNSTNLNSYLIRSYSGQQYLETAVNALNVTGIYALKILVFGGTPSPWTMRVQMNCLKTDIIPNCDTYNTNQDHCQACNGASSILAYTNFIPLQTCISTQISKCVFYTQDGSTCVRQCSNQVVMSNIFPPPVCVAGFIPNCQAYSYDGNTCATCDPTKPTLVVTVESPYLACTSTVVSDCVSYNYQGTQCRCYTANPIYLITNQAPFYFCVSSILIPNCQVYNADATTCITCSSSYSHYVITNYYPYKKCIQNVMTNCLIYDSNNNCAKCESQIQVMQCFYTTDSCTFDVKNNNCVIGPTND